MMTTPVTILLSAFMCLPVYRASRCPDYCANCNGINCNYCFDGYWLSAVNTCERCLGNCATCDRDNYMNRCNICKPTFWGLSSLCLQNCPTNCLNRLCAPENGNCYQCINGSYGLDCTKSCSMCKNNQCSQTQCVYGCIDGYFQDSTQESFFCRECASGCVRCDSLYHCLQCNTSSFISTYISNAGYTRSFCEPCRLPNCTSCLDIDTCTSCQIIPNCLQCRLVNDTFYTCSLCENGYTLTNGSCQQGIRCPSGCFGGCDRDGTCVLGCTDGFSGQLCNKSCSGSCLRCRQTDQNECTECQDAYYTTACNISCNPNCIRVTGQSTCGIDGFCINGCMPTVWGNMCEQTCSTNCLNSNDLLDNEVCNRMNGTCVYGCVNGYSGPMCSIKVTENTVWTPSQSTENAITTRRSESSTQSTTENRSQSDSQEAKGSMATTIGAGVGGGVAVATIIVIVIVVIMRKRRTEKDNRYCFCLGGNPGKSTITFTDNQPTKLESQGAASHEDESYVYALPNKHKQSQKVNVDISNPQTNASSIATIDLDAETDEEESNIDETIRLEDIDDGEAVVMEREVPVSDTYYNMAGLLRSRIQIQNLLEYLRNKRDFETEFEKLPKGLTRTCHEALTPFNRGKNRYNGIYAYDATRVVLRSSAYINACYIERQGVSRAYIASLGPTKNTMNKFSTFWEMVWQENTQTIVMLTNLVENDKMKCEQYWPDDGSMRQYGEFSVSTVSEQIYAEFVVRELHVVKARDTRKVMQYHYTAWPDKSYPDTVVSLLEFRDKVEQNQTNGAGPIVVHCSAGIGRTGTYIALDMLIKEGRTEQSVDVFGCVIGLRGQRTNMVQNVEQYRYLHHCVVYALTCYPKPLNVDQLTSSNDQSEDQFQALENIPSLPDTDAVAVGANKRRKEHRKGADIPGDLHRVKLKQTKKDYVNAVYLDTYRHKKHFILAQTPMPNTVDEFVSLIFQEDVEKIVCLDDESFTDKNVAQYLPTGNRVSKFGHIQLLYVKQEAHDSFIQREITISKIGSASSNEKKLMHYQYRGWSTEDNIPTRQTDFLQFLNTVSNKSGHGRDQILLHCLDGAKKSGLFCAVAIMLEKLSVDKEVSVINTVCQVRGRRRSALQNYEQFKFCYTCIREHIETSEAKTYYNIL